MRGVAGSTPLGESRRSNLDGETYTPAPIDHTMTRRSSMATPTTTFVTPNEVGRTMTGGHGVKLHQSTMKMGRVMKRVEEENRPVVASLRRERMLA